MYRTVKARVCKGSKVTDAFFCFCFLPERSQRRGNLLFSLFINDLATDITKNGRHDIQLLPDMIELFILLFSDDIVLLSDTIVELQN